MRKYNDKRKDTQMKGMLLFRYKDLTAVNDSITLKCVKSTLKLSVVGLQDDSVTMYM